MSCRDPHPPSGSITTATATKTSLKEWSRAASNLIALIPTPSIRQMLAIFFWSLILKYFIEVQEKKKKVVVLCSGPPQNVKLGTFMPWTCNDGKEMLLNKIKQWFGGSTSTKWVFVYLIPGRIGIWKRWFLRRGENRSTRRKTSRSKGENQQQT